MHNQHRVLFLARLVLVLAMAPVQSGCRIILIPHRPPPAAVRGVAAPGSTATPGPAPAPRATPAPAGPVATLAPPKPSASPAAPPPIKQPGKAATTPPAASLPPPRDVANKIAALRQKYGIRDISGSNATPDVLEKLDRVFATLPRGVYANLAIDCEPANATPDAKANEKLAAYWTNANADGSALPERFKPTDARGGRMHLFRSNPTEWTITHETCHHITIVGDQGLWKQLAADLGYERADSRREVDEIISHQDWVAKRVDDTTCPTDYAKTKLTEHIAELMTTYIRGKVPQDRTDPDIRKEFTGPGKAGPTLAAKLGPGKL
jgi:hypothetical protein